MIVKVGTVVQSDWGTGPVVAITKGWLIHEGYNAVEFALSREDDEYWIPTTEEEHEIGGGQTLEIEHP